MLVTDCFWQQQEASGQQQQQQEASGQQQQQEASGQQQQQYREVCYTDADTLEECTPSGYGLTGGNIGHPVCDVLQPGKSSAQHGGQVGGLLMSVYCNVLLFLA
jgi:hypothetical protein